MMGEPRLLTDGISFGESPRWHAGRLWVSDWGTQELLAIDPSGTSEAAVRLDLEGFQPICIDWLPDGRLLIVSSRERRLMRQEADGSLVEHADLSRLFDRGLNEIVVDGRGNAYVNGSGFDLAAGEEFAPGSIALVAADGSTRTVADDIAFPNGMAVRPDNSTLIVAESYANRLTAFTIEPDGGLSGRRVWAHLGDHHPDGICVDAGGAVWYGDVPNRCCVRVREGGERLEVIELDRGCFACALGGEDGRDLFLVAREWRGIDAIDTGERTGQVLVARGPAPRAGWP
jgi:sugar lactone lactonase YvrE